MSTTSLADDVRALLLAANRTEQPSKTESRAVLVERKRENLAKRSEALHDSEGRALSLLKRVDYSNIVPTLAAVPPRDVALWRYYRNVLSSAPYEGQPGRVMQFFVLDRVSNGVMGVVELSSDLDTLGPRDRYIGWTRVEKYRKRRMHSIANMTTCVVASPFGALTGGKCAAAMIVSSDVARLWQRKYGEHLIAITTTSLYGKSSQYNRLPQWRYIGLTPGRGVATVSERDYALVRRLLRESGQVMGLAGFGGTTGGGKMANIAKASLLVGVEPPSSAMPKGVYWAELSTQARSYLRAEIDEVTIDVPSMSERSKWWLERWYAMRWPKVREQIAEWDVLDYSLTQQQRVRSVDSDTAGDQPAEGDASAPARSTLRSPSRRRSDHLPAADESLP